MRVHSAILLLATVLSCVAAQERDGYNVPQARKYNLRGNRYRSLTDQKTEMPEAPSKSAKSDVAEEEPTMAPVKSASKSKSKSSSKSRSYSSSSDDVKSSKSVKSDVTEEAPVKSGSKSGSAKSTKSHD
ncbi:unnamed protein product [Chrysoparadoxa australica]